MICGVDISLLFLDVLRRDAYLRFDGSEKPPQLVPLAVPACVSVCFDRAATGLVPRTAFRRRAA
jgi:hypothetical protein